MLNARGERLAQTDCRLRVGPPEGSRRGLADDEGHERLGLLHRRRYLVHDRDGHAIPHARGKPCERRASKYHRVGLEIERGFPREVGKQALLIL